MEIMQAAPPEREELSDAKSTETGRLERRKHWETLIATVLQFFKPGIQKPLHGGTPRQMLGDVLIAYNDPIPAEILEAIDEIYRLENIDRQVQQVLQAPGTWLDAPGGAKVLVYRGDITALSGVDAIVNAANEAGLGCFIPSHRCIDNVIHRASGPRLREECNLLMSARSEPLSAGTTPLLSGGYHLPAPHVLHVTGPQMRKGTEPTQQAQTQLASCYTECLDTMARSALRSIAFNCISTGLFGYPQRDAAELALRTVKNWLIEHPGYMDLIVFDVFTPQDHEIYNVLAPQIFEVGTPS